MIRNRLLAALAVSALAFVTISAPAHAATPEAVKAADYIVANAPAPTADGAGAVADEILALASTNDAKYQEAVQTRVAFLEAQAQAFVTTSGETGAAKLVIVAAALGKDPKSFGGVDLVAKVKAGIKADGSFGAYPGPFASGMAMVALARADEEIPTSMTAYLLTYQAPDKSFAYMQKQTTGDADNTALAVLGLQAAKSSDPALAAGIAWLESNQQADGSWAGYAPVNSTGVAAPLTSDTAREKAAQYVVSQQLPSGAFKTGEKGKDDANLLATVQGILALTNKTYLSLDYQPNQEPATTTGTAGGSTSGVAVGAGLAAAAVAALLSVGLLLLTGRAKV